MGPTSRPRNIFPLLNTPKIGAISDRNGVVNVPRCAGGEDGLEERYDVEVDVTGADLGGAIVGEVRLDEADGAFEAAAAAASACAAAASRREFSSERCTCAMRSTSATCAACSASLCCDSAAIRWCMESIIMAWWAAMAAEAGDSGGNMAENGPGAPGPPGGVTPVRPVRPGKRAEKIAIIPIVPHLILLP